MRVAKKKVYRIQANKQTTYNSRYYCVTKKDLGCFKQLQQYSRLGLLKSVATPWPLILITHLCLFLYLVNSDLKITSSQAKIDAYGC